MTSLGYSLSKVCRRTLGLNRKWNYWPHIIEPQRPNTESATGVAFQQQYCTAASVSNSEKSLLDGPRMEQRPKPNEILLQSIEEDIGNLQKNKSGHEDMPIEDMANPYASEPRKCLICKYKISLDYKNVQLLSQFISPYTGRIYGRQITGLCIPMQKEIAKLIKRSRRFGFMPYILKKSEYLNDPKIYDTFGYKK